MSAEEKKKEALKRLEATTALRDGATGNMPLLAVINESESCPLTPGEGHIQCAV